MSRKQTLSYSLQKNPVKPVTIIITIEQKDHVKYLGILIVSKQSFKQHITFITKKISRAIGLLYKLQHDVSKKVLIMMYSVAQRYGWGHIAKLYLGP